MTNKGGRYSRLTHRFVQSLATEGRYGDGECASLATNPTFVQSRAADPDTQELPVALYHRYAA